MLKEKKITNKNNQSKAIGAQYGIIFSKRFVKKRGKADLKRLPLDKRGNACAVRVGKGTADTGVLTDLMGEITLETTTTALSVSKY